MKRTILLILLLAGLCFGQAKYFLPVLIESSNGRPIKNQDVDLYLAGTATLATQCTWLDGGRYYYTDTTAVPPGLYDLYLNDISFITNLYVGVPTISGLADAWNLDILDSLAAFKSVVSDSLDKIRETDVIGAINDSLTAIRNTFKVVNLWKWVAPSLYVPIADYINLYFVKDSIEALRSELHSDISDSLDIVADFWDVIWSYAFVSDTTGSADVRLWNTDYHRIRAASTLTDTILTLPIYKKSDMDSIAIVYQYQTQNASNGAIIVFSAGAASSTSVCNSSVSVETKRQSVSLMSLGNDAVYSVMLKVSPISAATNIYIWPVMVNVLRNKR